MELRQRTKVPSNDREAAAAASSDSNNHSSDDSGGGPTDPLDFPWLRDFPHMPSRLRHLLSDPTLDVTSRICRDVVVRLPIVGASEGDVMAIAAHFGDAEYISHALPSAAAPSKARRMARSFGAQQSATSMDPDAAQEASPEEGDPYCHYIRFVEGRDAIRCVLQLNGTIIDPAVHKKTMDQIGGVVEAECHKASQRAEEENAPSAAGGDGKQHAGDEAQLWKDLNDAVKKSQASNDIVCADPGAQVVVVTCDFFRAAFLEHPGTARLTLLMSDSGLRRPTAALAAKGPTQWLARLLGGWSPSKRTSSLSSPTAAANRRSGTMPSPLKAHQYALFVAGVHLERWYHRTVREASIQFEDFAFAVNYFTLFFEHDASALVPPLAARYQADDVAGVAGGALPTYRPWAVVHHALAAGAFSVEVCLSWLDIATNEAALWQGQRGPVASNHSNSSRRRKGAKAVVSKAKDLLQRSSGATQSASMSIGGVGVRAILLVVVVLAVLGTAGAFLFLA